MTVLISLVAFLFAAVLSLTAHNRTDSLLWFVVAMQFLILARIEPHDRNRS